MAPGDLPRVLLDLARDDDFAARSLLPVEGVADAILGFHAQQAVEKSLKAVLASADVQFPYTHDLDGLIELCRGHGLKVPDALEDADQLSPYGVRMRYGASHDTRLDRDQALGWSAAAVEWARGIVDRDDEEPAKE
jgi:HEPN domain-containing protein